MKRIAIIWALLMVMAMPTLAQETANCNHYDMEVSQVDGVMKFHCNTCKKDIDYTKWEQKGDDFGLSVIDPFLNMQADIHEIGSQTLMVNSTNSILHMWVMRNEDNKLLYYKDAEDKPTSLVELVLPWYEKQCHLTIVALVKVMKLEEDADGKYNQTYHNTFAVLHATQLPFHRIHNFEVKEIAAKDSDGVAHPFNRIQFAINQPDSTDVMGEDLFILYRSKTPDFSEMDVISSFYPEDYTYKSNGMGWFVYDDTDEEAGYNTSINLKDTIITALTHGADSIIHNPAFTKLDQQILEGFYTHPTQPIYYMVARAMASSLWPSHRGAFIATDTLQVSRQLPSVSKVQIKPSTQWARNKKSVIKITMDNPLPWEYNELEDASLVERYLQTEPLARRRYVWDSKAQIRVKRYSPKDEWDKGVDLAAMEYVIPGDKVKWNSEEKCWEAELEDCQALPYTHYYYNAVVERGEAYIPLAGNNSNISSSESDAELCYSEIAALVNTFTASQGTLPGRVHLEWTLGVGKVDKISVMRRENSKNRHGDWVEMPITDPMQREYLDETALAGYAYEYKLQTSFAVREKEIADSALVRGWGSYRSSISGYITMPNGTAIAHERVRLTRSEAVFIDDVMDEDSVIIMYGYHDGVMAEVRPQNNALRQHRIGEVVSGDTLYSAFTYTDEKGYFEFNDLPYMGDGTKYKLNFDRSYKTGGVDLSEVLYVLSNDRAEIKNQKFICSDVATFSGNVVYSESTVPVMDAHFVVDYKNDKGDVLSSSILRDSKGDPIRSDANGAFAFTVPAGKIMSIRVEKEAHQFSDNGCLLVDNKQVFSPKAGEKYVIPQVNDATRIRLVGRMVGGNVEARKQLGFSKSKNNIGDELALELQLEGNNTSWLVFHNDRPDDTTIKQTVQHPAKVLTYQPETNVTYEKKRILIHPDPRTGEFFVDLIPTKYRVSQLTAMGYPTLYQKGEGLQILDLNDSTVVKTMVSQNDESLKYDYHATYQRIYHVTPTVTYEQFKQGQFTGYLGEKEVKRNDIAQGGEVSYDVASFDSKTGKVHYTFGYPVFNSDHSYQLQAYAHEDFYYNNNPLGEMDEVPLDSGVLHVQNGLLDNKENKSYQLNSNGRTNFVFTVGNPIFGLTGDKALRTMNIAVELNGLYIEAEPLKAFVAGHRKIGEGIMPMVSMEGKLRCLDVLRDPPGKTSYAWREKGTSYSWSKSSVTQDNKDLAIRLGFGTHVKVNTGLGWIVESHSNLLDFKVMVTGNVNIPLKRENDAKSGNYKMTLGEKIQTSNDPYEVGAIADVYIGLATVDNLYSTENYTVLSETEYSEAKTNIDNGVIKLVSTGMDAEGNKQYLVVSRAITMMSGVDRTFIYTQRHILGTLIPELKRQRELLLSDYPGLTDEEVQKLANERTKVIYRRDSTERGYTPFFPQLPGFSETATADSVSLLNYNIAQWEDLIRMNEEGKAKFISENKPFKKYSVAGASVNYSESSSSYYTSVSWTGAKNVTWGINAGLGGEGGDEDKNGNNNRYSDEEAKKDNWEHANLDDYGNPIVDDDGNPEIANPKAAGDKKKKEDGARTITAFGLLFDLNFNPTFNTTTSGSADFSKTNSTGYGYQISTNDNGYMDVDVFAETQDADSLGYSNLEFIQAGRHGEGDAYKDEAQVHNFAFAVKGGAARNPYFEPDSTLYYTDPITGEHVALGTRMLKIDNPRIYVDHPVVNNQPEDESATIRIRLVNETEINDKAYLLAPSSFKLSVDEGTNPNGAEIMIDGMSLSGGKEITIAPGQSVEKTLKINRGVGYDFENIRLVFRDAAKSLKDVADISIHYLPVASPINITSPEDKWTMNTLSPQDEKGYYVPVSIDGYNVNSDGFHHLELQYKKKTDGESKWICVCAYYNDSTLYREATGVKEMLPTTGRINDLKFYGEKDPMEMEYDLRAVTFRKLGTGFITRASNVMSGRKDTRCPRVFGTAKPANGILTFADVISIPFNEPIADNYLDKIANFEVTGRTNNSKNNYATALFYPIEDNVEWNKFDTYYTGPTNVPHSKVKLNLSGNDLTLGMMLKINGQMKSESNLFSIINCDEENAKSVNMKASDFMMFTITPEKKLIFDCNDVAYTSEPLGDVNFDQLQRVGFTFKNEPDKGEPQVHFFVNGTERKLESLEFLKDSIKYTGADIANEANFRPLKGYGHIILGDGINMSCTLTDVRIWNRALPAYELTQKHNQYVSENELGLVSYWPVDEGMGKVLHDIVNGADLYIDKQSWVSTEKQYALALKNKKVELKAEDITRLPSYDYTLSMWMRAADLATDSVDIFTTGDKAAEYFRLGTKNDSLSVSTITNGAKPIVHNIVPESAINDHAWHHVAIVANKSQNTCAIYFDGNLAEQCDGTMLGGIANYNVYLGDQNFRGNIDNLQLWDHAFPSSSIEDLMRRSATGREMGLLYNLPFEQTITNGQGSPIPAFSPFNTVYRKKESTDTYLPLDSAFTLTDDLVDEYNISPAKPSTGEKNIQFDWSSSNNELQLHLLAADSEINHQNINVVVRGVEDLAGNAMQDPHRISLYVDKNVLRWQLKTMTLRTKYGEGKTQHLKFENISGQELKYNIYEYCKWLTLDKTEGYLEPLAEDELELTISKDLAPGEYNTSLYLRDENDLYSQVFVQLFVEAEEPDWQVTDDPAYTQQMNITAQVRVKGTDGYSDYVDNDKRDIIYAFHNGVCLGKAHISTQNDESLVFLTILGKESMNRNDAEKRAAATIDFRIWRASTGNISYLNGSYTDKDGNLHDKVQFAQNTILGTHTSPVMLRENDNALQQINLKKGWNWVSLNVRPFISEGVNGLFETTSVFSPGDIINVMGGAEPSYMQTDGIWGAGKDALPYSPSNVLQVYVHNDCTARVVGTSFKDSDRKITIPRTGWNDLAYLRDKDLPINIALGEYRGSQEAKEMTVVMGREGFAQLENNKWYGSLDYLHPGQGYYLYHLGTPGIEIHYYDDNVNQKKEVAARRSGAETGAANDAYANADAAVRNAGDQNLSGEAVSRNYQTSMGVIAAMAEGADMQEGDVLVAYADDEEVGRATVTTIDDGRERYFVSLSAAPGSMVTWALERDGQTVQRVRSKVRYAGTTVVGTISDPLVIDFKQGSDTSDSVIYYTADGIRQGSSNLPKHRVLIGDDGSKVVK